MFVVPKGSLLFAQSINEENLDGFRYNTPSDEYANPDSFFFFHGYATLTYSRLGSGLGSETGVTPQILIPSISPRTGENESGFQHDAAIFVGSKPTEDLYSVLEIHFVRNALDPVITEAKLSYNFYESNQFRVDLTAGRYWWPFGNHNAEWFSSANLFNFLSPAAAEVVPAHFNEIGATIQLGI